jgi:hypothetical protein
VYSHPPEVVAEARLHEGPRLWIERLPGPVNNFMNDGRRFKFPGLRGGVAIRGELPAATLFARAVDARVIIAGAPALQESVASGRGRLLLRLSVP